MTQSITIRLEPRTMLGKQVKRLRRQGITPIHLYGPGISSQALQAPTPAVLQALTQAGRSTPLSVTVEGQQEEHLALIREVRWNPMKGDLLHVDLLRVEATQAISAEVPIVFTGRALGANVTGGSVAQTLRTIHIEARPMDLPHEVTLDLAILAEPDSIARVGDIPLAPNVTS